MCAVNHFYVCYDPFIRVPCICDMLMSQGSLHCVTQHSNVWHDSLICVPWLTRMRTMTHFYVCHDSLVRVPWLMHMWHVDESGVATLRHATLKCVTWLTHMCATTHSYVCHDSFICVPWLTRTCAMPPAYVTCGWVRGCYNDSFICVPWLIRACAMTYLYVTCGWNRGCYIVCDATLQCAHGTYEWIIWMNHGTHMSRSWHTYEWVMTHIPMSHVIHMIESYHTCEWAMAHI